MNFALMYWTQVETGAEAVLRVDAPAISSRLELQVSGKGKDMSLEAVGRDVTNCALPLFCAGLGSALRWQLKRTGSRLI